MDLIGRGWFGCAKTESNNSRRKKTTGGIESDGTVFFLFFCRSEQTWEEYILLVCLCATVCFKLSFKNSICRNIELLSLLFFFHSCGFFMFSESQQFKIISEVLETQQQRRKASSLIRRCRSKNGKLQRKYAKAFSLLFVYYKLCLSLLNFLLGVD